jgi:hypothetical protein
MRNLKLIWDFRGPDALKIAQHHEIHLKDYINANQVSVISTGVEALSNMHVIAFLAVKEDVMKPIRDDLKPHRGQVYKID